MMTQPLTVSDNDNHHNDRSALDQRFQSIAWALFLIMTGVIYLLPDAITIHGLWPLCTGLILVGLNVVRAFNDIETSGFTLILGLLAMSMGLGALLGVSIFLFPVLLIGIGSLLILRTMRE